MSHPTFSRSEYVDRVSRLLGDIDADDRSSVLADLREQLMEIQDGEAVEILGTPESFVVEYLSSAGLLGRSEGVSPVSRPDSEASQPSKGMVLAILVVGAIGALNVVLTSSSSEPGSPWAWILPFLLSLTAFATTPILVLRAVQARSSGLPGANVASAVSGIALGLVVFLLVNGISGMGLVVAVAVSLIAAVLVQMALGADNQP